MPDEAELSKPSRIFWIVAVVALVWNLIGIATFVMSLTVSPEALDAMPEAERALYSHIPFWVTTAYAIAVFGGTLGCVALLMRKAWAVPLFAVSLLAITIQMSHALLGTALLEVRGATAALVPLLIVAVAVYLFWFSQRAKQQSWIA